MSAATWIAIASLAVAVVALGLSLAAMRIAKRTLAIDIERGAHERRPVITLKWLANATPSAIKVTNEGRVACEAVEFSVHSAQIITAIHALPLMGHVALTAGSFGSFRVGESKTFVADRGQGGTAHVRLRRRSGGRIWPDETVQLEVPPEIQVASEHPSTGRSRSLDRDRLDR